MARLLLAALLVVTLFSIVSAFRGGHGRPLYGVIGDSFTAGQGVPMRGFQSYGKRDTPTGYNLFDLLRNM